MHALDAPEHVFDLFDFDRHRRAHAIEHRDGLEDFPRGLRRLADFANLRRGGGDGGIERVEPLAALLPMPDRAQPLVEGGLADIERAHDVGDGHARIFIEVLCARERFGGVFDELQGRIPAPSGAAHVMAGLVTQVGFIRLGLITRFELRQA